MKLYLDNNVYNRPFDDQSIPRNRDEARAILRLLEKIGVGEIDLVSSFVVETEYAISPFGARRESVGELMGLAKERVRLDPAITRRAKSLEEAGLRGRDALHLAAAEHAGVDYLVTCDNKLLKRARRLGSSVRVISPLAARREERVVQIRNLTDAEIDKLGYQALLEKLGPVGAARFIRLQLERSRDDYLTADKPIDHMTVEEIYAEAVRLEAKRKEERGEG